VATNNAAASKVAVRKGRELNIDQFLKQKGKIAVRVAQWVLQRNDARNDGLHGLGDPRYLRRQTQRILLVLRNQQQAGSLTGITTSVRMRCTKARPRDGWRRGSDVTPPMHRSPIGIRNDSAPKFHYI